MKFSLFFFADDRHGNGNPYDLLLESAKWADDNSFHAVWTPERHFHSFGGSYPNPSVIGAALAGVTASVQIRAGSVVAPLHHPVRIAEEWAVVDQLSRGRVGVSFASGWHARDFTLGPDAYRDRHARTVTTADQVRRLWRGEAVDFPDGVGETGPIRTYPRPLQPELPFWLTSAGSPVSVDAAADAGGGLLTHLLGQDLEALSRNIQRYRAGLAQHHGSDTRGQVTLMLHTYVGADSESTTKLANGPLAEYLRRSIDLASTTVPGLLPDGATVDTLDPADRELLVERAVARYTRDNGLIGDVDRAVSSVEELAVLGVDEVACLIDFGIAPAEVMRGLRRLDEVRTVVQAGAVRTPLSVGHSPAEGTGRVGRSSRMSSGAGGSSA